MEKEYITKDDGKFVADMLRAGGTVIFSFDDEEGTHLDILMCWDIPLKLSTGILQRGISSLDLFVSIMSMGATGFATIGKKSEKTVTDLHPAYVGEKLGLGRIENPTTESVAKLISDVRRELWMKSVGKYENE